MKTILLIIQVLISFLLVVMILLQAKGAGLGSAFGGSGMIVRTRRGVEKLLFNLTVIIAFIFLVISLLSVIIA